MPNVAFDGASFENEVRRVARLLWPTAEYGGAAMEDGRERDGVFITDEVVHLIECTMFRTKDKAEKDIDKLIKLSKKMAARFKTKVVRCWFITLDEPTAEQRGIASKYPDRLVALSLAQFRSKLVDSASYLSLRLEYPFGSVRDPETGRPIRILEYISQDLITPSGEMLGVEDAAKRLLDTQQNRVIILGDYGAGKSSTMREIFKSIAAGRSTSGSFKFPILLNLRDHHGQTDPTEALERHARRIALANPSHLVRAWRAGYVVLLLDGFDEIATAGWAGKTKKLRDLRWRSMELIRSFVSETPLSSGVAIAGRAHFFDSENEMTRSLGTGNTFEPLTLSEFTPEQVERYLAHKGWHDSIPGWLPTRPLLLGYLASRGLLKETLEVEVGSPPALGWHRLLDRIAEREAEIEAGLDPDTVRQLIERLASVARSSVDGLGPLTSGQIKEAFNTVCGYPPDDRGIVLLQRLPGLAVHSPEDGTRRFLDQDFAQVASAGGVYSFLLDPYNYPTDSSTWQCGLEQLGIEVLAHRCHLVDESEKRLSSAAQAASKTQDQGVLLSDILRTIHCLGFQYGGPPLFVKNALVPDLTLDNPSADLSLVEFQDVLIASLELAPEMFIARLPRFVRCDILTVVGRTGAADMPVDKFLECRYDEFVETGATTDSILQMDLPMGGKVLLTILRKIYTQRGRGRRESALYRGLDHRAQRLVADVLDLMKKEGFVIPAKVGGQVVWLPTRSPGTRVRALKILSAPHVSNDTLFQACASLA